MPNRSLPHLVTIISRALVAFLLLGALGLTYGHDLLPDHIYDDLNCAVCAWLQDRVWQVSVVANLIGPNTSYALNEIADADSRLLFFHFPLGRSPPPVS